MCTNNARGTVTCERLLSGDTNYTHTRICDDRGYICILIDCSVKTIHRY